MTLLLPSVNKTDKPIYWWPHSIQWNGAAPNAGALRQRWQEKYTVVPKMYHMYDPVANPFLFMALTLLC